MTQGVSSDRKHKEKLGMVAARRCQVEETQGDARENEFKGGSGAMDTLIS